MGKFKDYIKEYIADGLESLKGQSLYGCDLAGEIYASDNMTGSITCNAGESMKNLRANEEYFRHALEYHKNNYGAEDALTMTTDYFDNPERAECLMVFCYVDAAIYALLQYKYKGKDLWNNKFIVDEKFIRWAKKDLADAVDAGFEELENY